VTSPSSSSCTRFEQAVRRDDPTAVAALEALRLSGHPASCADCAEKLALWDAIDREAPALRREWPSPGLMPKFAAALEAEKARGEASPPEAVPVAPRTRRWIPVAAAAALFVLSMVGLQVFQAGRGREILDPTASKTALLTDRSLDDVEAAEARYVESIEKLSAQAAPRIAGATTPLLVSYREKLLVLDSAIAEMRGQIENNRFNSHLRRELLAMYQEKQRTLQEVMKEEKS
jgi:hypothetical protein